MHRAAKIDHRDQTVRTGVGIDKLCRCLPGPPLVAGVHGGVVEEQHQVLLLCPGGGGGVVFEVEALDRLFLIVFPDFEILHGEVANVVALLVGHNHVHRDFTGLHFDSRNAGSGCVVVLLGLGDAD